MLAYVKDSLCRCQPNIKWKHWPNKSNESDIFHLAISISGLQQSAAFHLCGPKSTGNATSLPWPWGCLKATIYLSVAETFWKKWGPCWFLFLTINCISPINLNMICCLVVTNDSASSYEKYIICIDPYVSLCSDIFFIHIFQCNFFSFGGAGGWLHLIKFPHIQPSQNIF